MTPARLARIVLALYPARVRDRYGAEIAELLAHSRRPGRDPADIVLAVSVLPVSSAFVAYPAVISGVDPFAELGEALKALPALLTVCTSYALARVFPCARQQHPAPAAVVAATP